MTKLENINVTFIEDDSYKRKRFIVANVSNSCSFNVSYDQFIILKEIYNITKVKKLTNQEIETKIAEKLNFKINLNEIETQLSNKGLFKKNDIGFNHHSEMDMLGITILKLKFSKILPFLYKIANVLLVFKWLCFFIIAAGIYALIFNSANILSVLKENLYYFNNSAIAGAGLSMLISFIVILIHEFAHFFEALRQGITYGEFRFLLYAGFIPMYITKYPELMILKAKKKYQFLVQVY